MHMKKSGTQTGSKWVRMMAKITWKTAEEIEQERNAPKPPTMEERLEALELAMLEMVLGGGVFGDAISGDTGETGTDRD